MIKLFQPDTRQRRTMGALFGIAFVISMLLTAFFQTQVVAGEQYATRSEENRLRPIPIPAPRGTVYDRNRKIVATSIPGYTLSLLPGTKEVVERTLRDLAPFLGLSQLDIARVLKERNARPDHLLTITNDATYAQVAAIEERRTSFPNLIVTERPKRYYPAGPAIAHLIGYVAEISKEELEQAKFREAGYEQGRSIGKGGIERQYELLLGGREGARFVEVDAMGRVVDPRASVGALPPTPGEDLKLTLDLELQTYIHEIFPDSMKGAVVAMVPSTGEVLALYSHPTYDPNDFVSGIPPRLWQALNQDTTKPLLNRAMGALYPPASTFKLATAAAGLEKDLVTADTRMPIPCTGGMYYAGRYFDDWYDPPGFGPLNLVDAITHSCNVYFYQLGIQLGLNGLTRAGTEMGFNQPTGIDLPGEKTPVFPTSPQWYKERFGWAPTPSEVLSLAIGQGPNSQTVLKMAQFYSAIAGNGKAPEPYLVEGEGAGEGTGAIELDLSREDLQALWQGVAGVTSWDQRGTARLSALDRWKLYGKTGTAQNPHGPDHGWFAGFAGPPGKDPEIVVVALIEHGLHGSDVAPIAAKAAEFYLDRKYGLPVDREPTLIERLQSGRTSWSSLQ
jgi:penicillin-binding protein 2